MCAPWPLPIISLSDWGKIADGEWLVAVGPATRRCSSSGEVPSGEELRWQRKALAAATRHEMGTEMLNALEQLRAA